MLDQETRAAILKLHKQGMSIRRIARSLKISRSAVRGVTDSGTSEVPRIEREGKAEPYLEKIIELYAECKGNLVRVHEEIVAEGCEISYQALTAFCRRHKIGNKEKTPCGHYHFAPGQEMQHDTSPHKLKVGGRLREIQVASLVLCHSRILFFQYYPRFRRFECKDFLTKALRYVGGSCETCKIDNTHVVVLRGTGAQMQPVPEMAAFADQFGFKFKAHELGHANGSAYVERPFHFIENNFEVRREARNFADWNEQARAWCDKINARRKRHLRASPLSLLVSERLHLKSLPEWVP